MGEQLDLSVDRETEVPVSTQLIWKLRTLIATGALPPGARLPGIREVAPLDPLGTLQPRRGKSAPRLQSSTELRAIRDDLRKRIERLRTERDEWRAAQRAAEELEQEERVGPRLRAPSWRNAGVWTG